MAARKQSGNGTAVRPHAHPPGQVVLVLQGGGALGAFQAGVYEGLAEAGVQPDWIIGTSIGAINGAVIAGSAKSARVTQLKKLWDGLSSWTLSGPLVGGAMPMVNFATVMRGVPGFFTPNPAAWWGLSADVGVERAGFYQTAPLRRTLEELIDMDQLRSNAPRLTVGAVNVRTGAMRYFDSRDEQLELHHVMASGALPPAFPAVRVDDEFYWDGGLYSNTPIEAVMDDQQRRSSVVFAVQLWNPNGDPPPSIWGVMGRSKEIQYSSRAGSHIARQQQIHRLRHIIGELASRLPRSELKSPAVREMAAYGCRTTMHVVRLLAPSLDHNDHTKDIDFTGRSIEARWNAGLEAVRRALASQPWVAEVDPLAGVVVHDFESRAG
jgi:NTE family protein